MARIVIFVVTIAAAVTTPLRSQRPPSVDSAVAVIKPLAAASVRDLSKYYRTPAKREFETSSEYLARVRLPEPRQFHLVLIPDSLLQVAYDADEQTITATFTLPPLALASRDDIVALRRVRLVGSYRSTTAGGARLTVSEVTDTLFSFTIPFAGRDIDPEPEQVWFKMARDSARLTKPHIAGALIVRPAADSLGRVVTFATVRIEPTFSQPIDHTIVRRIVRADWMALILYDRRTGRILDRYVHEQ
jgi:hypothetical protein